MAALGFLAWLGFHHLAHLATGRQDPRQGAQAPVAAAAGTVRDNPPVSSIPGRDTAPAHVVPGIAPPWPPQPGGPGTMQDVEAREIGLAYLFSGASGKIEWVEQTLNVRNISHRALPGLVVPLLPGAFDAHLGAAAGTPLTVTHGAVTVPVRLTSDGQPYSLIHVTYQVPYNFLADQTWKVPTYSLRGLWIVFWPQETYLAVSGAGFHRDQAWDAVAGGGMVWASQAPVPRDTVLTWRIVPSSTSAYPSTGRAPPSPKACVSDSGQPLCERSNR
jgi:hypothetical protein